MFWVFFGCSNVADNRLELFKAIMCLLERTTWANMQQAVYRSNQEEVAGKYGS